MARIQTDPREVAEMAALLVRTYPVLSCYSAADLAIRLYAVERAARREAENHCNVPRTEEQERRAEARVQRASDRWLASLAELAGAQGVSLSAQGDPRGCVLQLHNLPGHSEPVRV